MIVKHYTCTECGDDERCEIHTECVHLTPFKCPYGFCLPREPTWKGQNYGYCGDVSGNPFGPADMP